MPLKRPFGSLSFRLATGFVLLFITFAIALAWVVYWIIGSSLTVDLQRSVAADIAAIQSGYAQEGIAEAREVVTQLLAEPTSVKTARPDTYIGLTDADGHTLAGNLDIGALRFGRQHQRLAASDQPGNAIARLAPNRARAHPIILLTQGVVFADGSRLVVGRDMAPIGVTRARVAAAFTWTAAIAIVLAVAAGFVFGIRFTRQTQAMSQTCDAIVSGHFGGRVAVRGSGDELDVLGGAINAMLDRIEMLLENLRQVSSDIAHDLRTPMARLRQRLEQARLDCGNAEHYGDVVSAAIADVDSILAIFAALLRISQIEAGTRSVAFAPVSLSEMLTRLVGIYGAAAEDMGHSVVLDAPPDVYIRGDAELLLQMFSNVLENALHHTPRGTRVEIQLRSSGARVWACIADNGPGIAADERDKVTRRFYRVASSRATPGNGLGLALVHAIAGLHRAGLSLSDNSPGLRVELTFESGSSSPG